MKVQIGTGVPQDRINGKYAHIFETVKPGTYVQFSDLPDTKRGYRSIRYHIKRRRKGWRAVLRSKEYRVYIVAADGDKPSAETP